MSPPASPLHPPSSASASPPPDLALSASSAPSGKEGEPGAEKKADEKEGGEPAAKKPRKRKKKAKKAEDDGGTAGDGTTSTSSLSTPSTVFVEGLPYAMLESELVTFLQGSGCPVESCRLPTWQDSGNLRGFGHVVFKTQAAAKKAIETVTGKPLPKYRRYLTFKPANVAKAPSPASSRPAPKSCRSVFVKNLPYSATEALLREEFEKFGKIAPGGVRLPLVNPTASEGEAGFGQVKGFGYVTFKEPEHAVTAVNTAAKPYGVTIANRPLFVDYDDKGEAGIKGSFRMQDGRNYNKVYGEQSGANGSGGVKRKAGPRL